MRWLNLSIILIYLSILLSSPVQAVTQNRVDLVGSGLSVHHAIMPLAQHVPGQSSSPSDTPDHDVVFVSAVINVCSQNIPLPTATLPTLRSFARLIAQPRAPPSFS